MSGLPRWLSSIFSSYLRFPCGSCSSYIQKLVLLTRSRVNHSWWALQTRLVGPVNECPVQREIRLYCPVHVQHNLWTAARKLTPNYFHISPFRVTIHFLQLSPLIKSRLADMGTINRDSYNDLVGTRRPSSFRSLDSNGQVSVQTENF